MTLTTKELLEKYAVRCSSCNQLATRTQTVQGDRVEVTTHCGPFRITTNVLDTKDPGVYTDDDFERIQSESTTMMNELSESSDLKPFMGMNILTETPMNAESYIIPVGLCYCDSCGPPNQLYIDLRHAHLVRAVDSQPIEERLTYNEWDHDVFLTEVGSNRVLCIKVVRELFGLNLDESRALVDNPPKKLRGEIELREARVIKSRFEKIGARVEIRQTEDGLIKD